MKKKLIIFSLILLSYLFFLNIEKVHTAYLPSNEIPNGFDKVYKANNGSKIYTYISTCPVTSAAPSTLPANFSATNFNISHIQKPRAIILPKDATTINNTYIFFHGVHFTNESTGKETVSEPTSQDLIEKLFINYHQLNEQIESVTNANEKSVIFLPRLYQNTLQFNSASKLTTSEYNCFITEAEQKLRSIPNIQYNRQKLTIAGHSAGVNTVRYFSELGLTADNILLFDGCYVASVDNNSWCKTIVNKNNANNYYIYYKKTDSSSSKGIPETIALNSAKTKIVSTVINHQTITKQCISDHITNNLCNGQGTIVSNQSTANSNNGTQQNTLKKIGQFCNYNSECITDDCENNVCDCSDTGSNTSIQCASGLQQGTAQDWQCLDEEKDPLQRGNEFCVKNTYTQSTYPNESTSDVIYPISKKLGIGGNCEQNEHCTTNYCEDSNTATDFDNYCVCKKAEHCQEAYGGDLFDWECNGGDDTNGLNYCKNKKTGALITALNTGYKNINGFDILTPEAISASFQNDLANIVQKPNPKIKIPGLKFSDVDIEKMSTTDSAGYTWLTFPFLGEYIALIYKYGIALLTLAAVISIIISGVTLIASGGNSDLVNQAKKRITLSVIALVIAASSYTILYTVNPELVNLKNIKILYVKGEEYSIPDNEEEYLVSEEESNSNPSSVSIQNPTISSSRIASVDDPQNFCFPISHGFKYNSNNWGQARKISIPLKNTTIVEKGIANGSITQNKKLVQCHQGLDLITDGENGNGTVVSMTNGKVISVMKEKFTTCKNGKSNTTQPGVNDNKIGMITVYDSQRKLTYVYGEINGDTVKVKMGDTVTKGQKLGIASKCNMLHLEIYKDWGRKTGDQMTLGGYTVGMGNWYLYDQLNLGELNDERGNRECAKSPYIEILDKINSTLLDPTNLIEQIKNNTCN